MAGIVAQVKGALGAAVDAITAKVGPKAVSYRRTFRTFKDHADLLANLRPGDMAKGLPESVVADLGEAEREVKSVTGSIIEFKDGKKVLVDWLQLWRCRTERLLKRPDPKLLKVVLRAFGDAAVARLGVVADAKTGALAAERTRLEGRLAEITAQIVTIAATKANPGGAANTIAARLQLMVENGTYTNIDQEETPGGTIFTLYTPTLGDGVWRYDYSVRVYPAGSTFRMQIENVTQGAAKSHVPKNELKSGLCNVCFGTEAHTMQRLVDDEEWDKVLTMVHDFLDGKGRPAVAS